MKTSGLLPEECKAEIRARLESNRAKLTKAIESHQAQIIIENIACAVVEDEWVLNDKEG